MRQPEQIPSPSSVRPSGWSLGVEAAPACARQIGTRLVHDALAYWPAHAAAEPAQPRSSSDCNHVLPGRTESCRRPWLTTRGFRRAGGVCCVGFAEAAEDDQRHPARRDVPHQRLELKTAALCPRGASRSAVVRTRAPRSKATAPPPTRAAERRCDGRATPVAVGPSTRAGRRSRPARPAVRAMSTEASGSSCSRLVNAMRRPRSCTAATPSATWRMPPA